MPTRTVYWKHLALMSDTDYRRGWQHKLALYRAHGLLPLDEGEGEVSTLIVTEEHEGAGLDMAVVED